MPAALQTGIGDEGFSDGVRLFVHLGDEVRLDQASDKLGIGHAGLQQKRRRSVILATPLIGQNQTVVLVIKSKGAGHALDGLGQPLGGLHRVTARPIQQADRPGQSPQQAGDEQP